MFARCSLGAMALAAFYLHEGKLFRFDREAKADSQFLLGFDPALGKRSRGVEFFWLCPKCAGSLTLIYCRGVGVTTHPVHPLLKAAS